MKSAKLAAKRAKVLSYEAGMAPPPDPIKISQPRAPRDSKQVRRLAAHLRQQQAQESSATKEKANDAKKEEDKAGSKPGGGGRGLKDEEERLAFDLWNNPGPLPKQLEANERIEADWVEPAITKPVKPPKGLLERQRVLKTRAVGLATPGHSYRPTYQDHQDLLGGVLAKKLKRQEENRRINRIVRPLKKGLKRKRSNMDDYTAGLEDILGIKKKKASVQGGTDEKEEEEEEEEERSDSRPVKRKRKAGDSRWSLKLSKAERNKLKKRENRRKTKKYKRLLLKRRRQLEAVPEIVQAIQEAEEKQRANAERKQAAKEEGKIARQFEINRSTPYLLTEELPKNLRSFTVPSKYNPIKEHFINFKKSNRIVSRLPGVHKPKSRRQLVKYYEPVWAKNS